MIIAPQVPVFEALGELSIGVPLVTMQSAGSSEDNSLWVDQVDGARRATRHVIDLGHERIAHLAGPQDCMEAKARLRGYHDEMAEHGLSVADPLAGTGLRSWAHARVPGCWAEDPARHQCCRFRGHTGSRTRLAAADNDAARFSRIRSPERCASAGQPHSHGAGVRASNMIKLDVIAHING